MVMLAFGGLGALLIRTELIYPGAKALRHRTYNTIVTMHGMLMILATITFFIGPFGNFIVPIMIGARDMAFPRLNALSFALLVPGDGDLRHHPLPRPRRYATALAAACRRAGRSTAPSPTRPASA